MTYEAYFDPRTITPALGGETYWYRSSRLLFLQAETSNLRDADGQKQFGIVKFSKVPRTLLQLAFHHITIYGKERH